MDPQVVESSDAAGMGIVGMLVYLVVLGAIFAGIWKVFTKAGQPGWAAIVPIYNLVVLMKIAGKPAWWVLLMLIPFVNFIVGILVSIEVAKAFGKGTGFGIGLMLLGPVFYPVLGFGSAQYHGAGAPLPAVA